MPALRLREGDAVTDMNASVAKPKPIRLVAADGSAINGFVWHYCKREECESAHTRHEVIVNAATSVRCCYYLMRA